MSADDTRRPEAEEASPEPPDDGPARVRPRVFGNRLPLVPSITPVSMRNPFGFPRELHGEDDDATDTADRLPDTMPPPVPVDEYVQLMMKQVADDHDPPMRFVAPKLPTWRRFADGQPVPFDEGDNPPSTTPAPLGEPLPNALSRVPVLVGVSTTPPPHLGGAQTTAPPPGSRHGRLVPVVPVSPFATGTPRSLPPISLSELMADRGPVMGGSPNVPFAFNDAPASDRAPPISVQPVSAEPVSGPASTQPVSFTDFDISDSLPPVSVMPASAPPTPVVAPRNAPPTLPPAPTREGASRNAINPSAMAPRSPHGDHDALPFDDLIAGSSRSSDALVEAGTVRASMRPTPTPPSPGVVAMPVPYVGTLPPLSPSGRPGTLAYAFSPARAAAEAAITAPPPRGDHSASERNVEPSSKPSAMPERAPVGQHGQLGQLDARGPAARIPAVRTPLVLDPEDDEGAMSLPASFFLAPLSTPSFDSPTAQEPGGPIPLLMDADSTDERPTPLPPFSQPQAPSSAGVFGMPNSPTLPAAPALARAPAFVPQSVRKRGPLSAPPPRASVPPPRGSVPPARSGAVRAPFASRGPDSVRSPFAAKSAFTRGSQAAAGGPDSTRPPGSVKTPFRTGPRVAATAAPDSTRAVARAPAIHVAPDHSRQPAITLDERLPKPFGRPPPDAPRKHAKSAPSPESPRSPPPPAAVAFDFAPDSPHSPTPLAERAPFQGPDPMQEIRDRFDAGDFPSALAKAERMLALDPKHTQAKRYVDNSRDMLAQKYLSRLGGRERVPRVVVTPTELRWLGLDHRAGFLISCIDGMMTIDEILDVSGMPELDALRFLYDFCEQSVINVDVRDVRPGRR